MDFSRNECSDKEPAFSEPLEIKDGPPNTALCFIFTIRFELAGSVDPNIAAC
jgi:hypothetical protein